MTRVKPGERKRTYNPKVKTGCTRTGRVCPGYENEQEPSTATAVRTRSISPTTPVSSTIWKSEQEWRAFQFFRECSAHQFQSFWPEDLWTETISRLAHYESGIRHALLALAAFHERYENRDAIPAPPDRITSRSDFALTQYNNSISSFLAPKKDGQVDIEVYLLSCIIFTAIEALRGNSASAIHLVRQGVKMLKEAKASRANGQSTKSSNSSISLDSLDIVFLRWEVQIQELFSDLFGDQAYEYSYQLNGADLELPKTGPDASSPDEKLSFNTVREARDVQDRYWHGLISHLNQLDLRDDDKVEEDRAEIMKTYFQVSKSLDGAFQDLSDRVSNSFMLPSEVRGIQIMKLWRLVFQASIQSQAGDDPQTPTEQQKEEHASQDKLFEQVVDLAESLLISASKSAHDIAPPPPSIVPHSRFLSMSSENEGSPPASSDHSRTANPSENFASEPRHDSLGSTMSKATSAEQSLPPNSHHSYDRNDSRLQSKFQHRIQPTFAPDISILPTLFGSFLRARDPKLRRRVIKLLRDCRRQEGLWNSRLFANVCERILELEAEGAAQEAAEDAARFSSATPSVNSAGSSPDTVLPDAHMDTGTTIPDHESHSHPHQQHSYFGPEQVNFDIARDHHYDQGNYAEYFNDIPDPNSDARLDASGRPRPYSTIDLKGPTTSTSTIPSNHDVTLPSRPSTHIPTLGDSLPPDPLASYSDAREDTPHQPPPNLRALGSYSLNSPQPTSEVQPPNLRALGAFSLTPHESPAASPGDHTSPTHGPQAMVDPHAHSAPRSAPASQDATRRRPADGTQKAAQGGKTARPEGWGKRNGGRKVTGVKIGLASEGRGVERLRVGFIFDGGRGVLEEVVEW
ncbi:hypothetical protein B9Z65_2906 [Elsinoe australis]|uniref:Uncharacterized protein n=1 Tax=Elsinoe australis TaxID=40998 RepID=A0A2P7ZTT1_9PEZI|nr:hypothetical protein B9Z65_2906 [Elsinoe australis]